VVEEKEEKGDDSLKKEQYPLGKYCKSHFQNNKKE